jgi:hypothetical protein
MMLRFPQEAFGRKNYTIVRIALDTPPKFINVRGDYLNIVSLGTTADVTKVYIGINTTEADLPISEAVPVLTPFTYITIRWEPSENNKTLTLIVGGEAVFSQYREGVVLVGDLVNVAKDSTLRLLTNALKSVDADRLNANVKTTEIAIPIDIQYDAVGLPTLTRFGRSVSPAWVIGGEVTAPAAGTNLVSRTVSGGRTGYVYGLLITAGESNNFRLIWTSGGTSRSLRFTTASRGSILVVSPVPLNEGLPADGGTTVAVQNVNAGSSGVVYQVAILYGEV